MIFISQPISAQPRIRKLLDDLQDTTASVYFLPDIYVFDLMQARFDNVGGMPVIAICERRLPASTAWSSAPATSCWRRHPDHAAAS
jgi:hypothetical protein